MLNVSSLRNESISAKCKHFGWRSQNQVVEKVNFVGFSFDNLYEFQFGQCWTNLIFGMMVQMFYYECRGAACRKILNHEGSPCKILLFADEGWARTAPNAHWILKRPWWSRTFCKITEITATRRSSTRGKIVDMGKGHMCIKGKFKDAEEPDFRMYLTTHVTSADFRQGYSMTGTLERGNKKKEGFHLTHFAMLRRKDYLDDDNNNK